MYRSIYPHVIQVHAKTVLPKCDHGDITEQMSALASIHDAKSEVQLYF